MIIVDVQQGSPEWFAARCGIPTASSFDKIVTSKGEPSKQAQKYSYQLAVERLTGRIEKSYSNDDMARGKEVEAEARSFYELIHEVSVKEVGVCYPDERKLCAASPDALVGDEGLLEIKCPLAYAAVGYILDGALPTDYFQQAQGQLFVTGREWLDFLSYYPGLKPMIVRVQRDEKFIKKLSIELEVFTRQLDDLVKRIK